MPTAEELAEAEAAVLHVDRSFDEPGAPRKENIRVPMAHLDGLKRIAACTQGDDTTAQALEAAEQLLGSAHGAVHHDRWLARDEHYKEIERTARVRQPELQHPGSAAVDPRAVDEASLHRLLEMGFERQVCVAALAQVGGDIRAATAMLLEGGDPLRQVPQGEVPRPTGI